MNGADRTQHRDSRRQVRKLKELVADADTALNVKGGHFGVGTDYLEKPVLRRTKERILPELRQTTFHLRLGNDVETPFLRIGHHVDELRIAHHRAPFAGNGEALLGIQGMIVATHEGPREHACRLRDTLLDCL